MRADSTGGQGLTLPLYFATPATQSGFASRARVLFHSGGQADVMDGNYVFENQTLEYQSDIRPAIAETGTGLALQEVALPIFSFAALILLILLRNIFFRSFQKYFLSFHNNYEIDFNIQKIGFPPLVMAMLIIVFAVSDYLHSLDSSAALLTMMKTIQLVFSPMAISAAALFLFSLSVRFFPIIFPDIKVLFFMAILLLAYNFAVYGFQGSFPFGVRFLLPSLAAFFFILRSFFLFMVFRKFFRYRSALSLFYICTLNLSTCLVLYEILK